MTAEARTESGHAQSATKPIEGVSTNTNGENFDSMPLDELMTRRAKQKVDDFGYIVDRTERDQLNEAIQRKSVESGGIPSV